MEISFYFGFLCLLSLILLILGVIYPEKVIFWRTSLNKNSRTARNLFGIPSVVFFFISTSESSYEQFSIIGGIVGALTYISIINLIRGLYNPKNVLFGMDIQNTKSNVLMIYGILLLISIAGGAFMQNSGIIPESKVKNDPQKIDDLQKNDDCKDDLTWYHQGREISTYASTRGGISFDRACEEMQNIGVPILKNECLKKGFNDAEQNNPCPYDQKCDY